MKLATKFFFACLFALSISLPAFSQDNQEISQQLIEIADEIYANTQAYIQARDAYIQVLDFDADNVKANYMAGKLYLQTINKERATPYLIKVLENDPEYSFDLYYLIGSAYQYNLDFDNAIKFFEQYLDKLANAGNYQGSELVPAASAKRKIEQCEIGKVLVANPLNYRITNIGPAINSEWPDYAPVVNREENILMFSSRRQEGNLNPDVFEDNFPFDEIFISSKEGGEWTPAENIGSIINTPFFESSLAISPDNKVAYFYYDENGGDIYYSNRDEDGNWTEPIPMSPPINSSFQESSITISPDGQLLIFTSDRTTSIGSKDLYFSIKDRRGKWANAENIGPVLNTEYDEDFPFIDQDGKTLYFSSRGHRGMGGYDIFMSVYDSINETWIEPVNLSYPINTPDNDISFITTSDGKRGYYSSVKDDSYGHEDIYMFQVPEEIQGIDEDQTEIEKKPTPVVTLKSVKVLIEVVSDQGQPLTANVKLRNDTERMLIPVSGMGVGKYVVYVNNPKNHKFHVSAELDGFMFENRVINIPKPSEVEQTVQVQVVLEKIKTGSWKVLRNIYFDFDKAVLKEDSHVELNKLYQVLQENNRLICELSGHTDNVGKPSYNKELSYNRAKAVYEYLVKKGIDPKRIQPVGYGEEKPMASNDDEEGGRELNRRVEFRVLKYLF